MKRYAENLSFSFGKYSSTLGEGLSVTLSSIESG